MRFRYVILHHTGIPAPHFDLMFETAQGASLATWRSPVWPIQSPTIVERLADHRIAYLDYEGPVNNDRGQVTRIAGGTFQLDAYSGDLVVLVIDQEHRFTFKRQGDTSLWQVEVGQTP